MDMPRSTVTYPIGYGTTRVSMEEMQRRFLDKMEPEYARRLFAWLASHEGHFGIGSAWRVTPHNASQASRDGKSFHQTQNFTGSFSGFCAVDLVVGQSNGQVHRAPNYDEAVWQGSDEAKRIGLHMNVSSETWHMQPIEIDGWQSWADKGRPRPAPGYPIDIPDVTVTPPEVPGGGDPSEWPPFEPDYGEYSLFPIAEKSTLHSGMTGQPDDQIRYLQAVLKNQCFMTLDIDGYFGPITEERVKQMQGWNALEQDGWCGPKTWACVDIYAVR